VRRADFPRKLQIEHTNTAAPPTGSEARQQQSFESIRVEQPGHYAARQDGGDQAVEPGGARQPAADAWGS
jgi:hypothetical protein